jgi:hypothetical protein
MKNRFTELMGITLLGVTIRLLKWDRCGLVTWRHIAENGKAEDNTEEDFEKIIKALSNDGFQGTFLISIVNGSAMVGWSINGKNDETV